MREWCVYRHTSPSNKVYIGVTCQKKPSNRWLNGLGYTDNTHFFNAIKKYGWKNFEHEILLAGLSKSDACQKEQELIRYHKSHDRDHGYNIELGGYLASDETRAKISATLKEKLKSPEARRALSSRAKRQWTHAEVREKCSESLKIYWSDKDKRTSRGALIASYYANLERRKWLSEKAKRQWQDKSKMPCPPKPVRCVETNVVFSSAKIAAIETGANANCLSECCNKKPKRNTSGGYHWEWYTEPADKSEVAS